MTGELVRTRAADGVRLDGFLEAAPAEHGSHSQLDAMICFSGVGSNFYASSLIERIAADLRSQGITTLRANTRGHDGISTASTPRGGILQGAAFERVDDCRHDMAAWVAWLTERGFSRIGLLGHSLGALKCLYAHVHEPQEAVRCVVAISPPRLSYSLFLKGPRSKEFQESLHRADALARDGEADALFRASFPFPLAVSAATYIDKYGPAEKYDLTKWVASISGEVILTFGGAELTSGNIAFSGLDQKLRSLPWNFEKPQVLVVPEADHFYAGKATDLISELRTALSMHGA